jgi:hypothetical protein
MPAAGQKLHVEQEGWERAAEARRAAERPERNHLWVRASARTGAEQGKNIGKIYGLQGIFRLPDDPGYKGHFGMVLRENVCTR